MSQQLSHGPIGARLRRPGRPRLTSDRVFWITCLVPPLAILALVFAFPLAYSFWVSLTDSAMRPDARFIGLQNYVNILGNSNVRNSIAVTLVFSAISLTLEFAIGFGLALLFNQIGFGRSFLRTLIVLPVMLTPVVMGLQWRMMLNYDFGIINYFVESIGLQRLHPLIFAGQAFASVIIVSLWHHIGFVVLVLSAGLATLSDEPFEAAEVDGASWWQRIWHVTLPMLRPVIVVVLLFRSYGLLRTFDTVFALTQGGPGRATEVLSYYIFSRMFLNFQIGYSAAVAFVLFAITLVICLFLIFFIDVEEGR